jgi:hypothetical protein
MAVATLGSRRQHAGMRPLLVAAVLILAACEPARPLAHYEARSAAVNWCIREGKAWGDPVQTEKPAAADARGRRWWTIRFAGADQVVLVDADSGWAKPAPAAVSAPAPRPAPAPAP